jgi:hypothetical protein
MSIQPPPLEPIFYETEHAILTVGVPPEGPQYASRDEAIRAALPKLARLLRAPIEKKEPCKAES